MPALRWRRCGWPPDPLRALQRSRLRLAQRRNELHPPAGKEGDALMYQEWIDLSKHQPRVEAKALDPMIRGSLNKATEGVRYEDPCFVDHCAAIRDAGRVLGAYHYLRIRHGAPQDAKAQAHEFAERYARERCEFGELDVEMMENESATAAEAHEAVADFHSELIAILNPPMLLYTSKGEWEHWALGDLHIQWPLSLAAYTDSFAPKVPLPWVDWLLHQYTGKGVVRGVTGTVDRYRSKGSLDDFRIALGLPLAPLPNLADDPRVKT